LSETKKVGEKERILFYDLVLFICPLQFARCVTNLFQAPQNVRHPDFQVWGVGSPPYFTGKLVRGVRFIVSFKAVELVIVAPKFMALLSQEHP